MSEYSLDEPGFAPPVPPVPPSSSESSVETPVDGRRKCIACPRRMSKKSADRHTLCVNCRGFDCDVHSRCEECLEWSEEEVIKYAKYRNSLKSRESSSRSKTSMPTPPPTTSGPSPQPAPPPTPQPAPRADLQSQVDSLNLTFQSLSDSINSRLTEFMSQILSHTQSSSQPRLGPDAGEPHPGRTAGESCMFQGMGASSRTPLVPPSTSYPLPHDVRAPQPEQSGRAQPRSPPFAAPRDSAHQAPRPPPGFEVPPQPSTSGWVPPGPPPPRSRRDSSASESEASEGESVASVRDSASARLADLIYEVCPESRPLFDARAPRCGFEAWFAALSRQARTAAAGSGFIRAKCRESLLAHTSLPVPETQKRFLTVTPGSSSGLFNVELLAEVVSQVQSSSQISSNLALSRSLRRGRSAPSSSSSPLTGPHSSSFSRGRPYRKRSSSSSRSGGRKRFKGGKGVAPSSGPSGFRK